MILHKYSKELNLFIGYVRLIRVKFNLIERTETGGPIVKVIPLYKMIVKEETDVSLAKKGNHEAFMTLIHTEKVKMYRIAKAMLRDETNIEDAMQATILKAYENIKKLKKEEFFQTWLIRILINECNNIIRSYKKVIVIEDHDSNMVAFDRYEDIDLCNAIQSLTEELRAVTCTLLL